MLADSDIVLLMNTTKVQTSRDRHMICIGKTKSASEKGLLRYLFCYHDRVMLVS